MREQQITLPLVPHVGLEEFVDTQPLDPNHTRVLSLSRPFDQMEQVREEVNAVGAAFGVSQEQG